MAASGAIDPKAEYFSGVHRALVSQNYYPLASLVFALAGAESWGEVLEQATDWTGVVTRIIAQG